MVIVRNAAAGTMESSDAMATVSPGKEGIRIELGSTVYVQFGRQIENLVRQVAEEAGVENADIKAQDFGALVCTIRVRVEAALVRASKEETAS